MVVLAAGRGDRRGCGLGGVALAWLLSRDQARAGVVSSARVPHHAAKAKRVVQVFCCGGVSHLETFDYKPELERMHGKTLEGKGENLGFFGQPGKVMKSVYDFRRHGQSGGWVSSLLPHLAGCVDDVCFIHSMYAKSNNHTPATFQMNSGFTLNGFPSMGAWLSYGLGTENENLPAFVVMQDNATAVVNGPRNWGAGFMPAVYQGTPIDGGADPIANLTPPSSIGRSPPWGRRPIIWQPLPSGRCGSVGVTLAPTISDMSRPWSNGPGT